MEFFFHDEQGRIVQTGSCPSGQLHLQARPKAQMRIGRASMGMHYWDGTKGLCVIPERPSPAHCFDYGAKTWALDVAKAWQLVRAERDRRIAQTDWRVTRASEQGAPLAPAWQQYRQDLRDVTEQDDPLAIVWPAEPSN